MNGLFISFEGPDGAGKTTQLKLLAHRLENKGQRVMLTREPGGTVISDSIRAILLNPDHQEMVPEAEVLLYAASRAQLVNERIRPALEEGFIVISDRFVDASIAYQSVGLQVDRSHVEAVNLFATGGLLPHRTYLIDVDPKISLARLRKREGNNNLDRIEQRTENYHRTVREAFLQMAQKDPNRFRLIEGNEQPEKLADQIWQDFSSRFL